MRRKSLFILATMLTLAAAPPSALASSEMSAAAKAPARPGDRAATKAYLQANSVLVYTAKLNMKTGESALESLRRTIAAECPKAAAASPQNDAATALSNEVIGALSIVFIRSDVQAVDDFAQTVEGLRWSNPTLTRKVGTYAAKFKALAALAPPDVCGDVRAWAASGYKTLPASTKEFDRVFAAEDVAIGEVPARLLAPYESARERGTLALTKRRESELVDAEARAVVPWMKILDALVLQP